MTLRELLEAFTPFATPASPEQWSCGVDKLDLECAKDELAALEKLREDAAAPLVTRNAAANREIAALRVCLTWIAKETIEGGRFPSDTAQFEKELKKALKGEP